MLRAPFFSQVGLGGSLPESICNVTNFQTLVLDGNQFISLPACMAKMTTLRVLSVPRNPIEAMPDLTILENLQLLDVSQTRVASLTGFGGELYLYVDFSQSMLSDMTLLSILSSCSSLRFSMHPMRSLAACWTLRYAATERMYFMKWQPGIKNTRDAICNSCRQPEQN
jgi:Leucine-rich repeat (LRR) protein